MPASLNTALPTNDLRSGAKSYRRDKSHNSKWANGVATKGKKCPNTFMFDFGCACGQCPLKPQGPYNHNQSHIKNQRAYKKGLNVQASTLARKAFRNEVVDAMDGPLANVSDPSSDEEVADTSAAPIPAEADFMYNYDAKTGPSAGRDILSHALNAAVQRFENTETEKLVSKEYDVIDDARESYTADEDEDDFEMIEHAHI